MSSAAVVNEMAEARRELAGQYGIHQNAEELIRAHQASIPPDVRAAALKPVDLDATKELDQDSIDLPSGHFVVDAVVREDMISYVADDGTGRWYKGVQPVGAKKSARAKAAVKDSAAEASLRHTVQSEAELRQAALDAQAEIAVKAAEARREAEAESAEQIAKLRAELAQAQEKLDEQAAKEEQKETSEPSRKTGGSRKRSGGRKKSGSSARSRASRKQAEG
jgi:hypothetical protein